MSLDTNENAQSQPGWQKNIKPQSTVNPLANHSGEPILGQQRGNKRYVGRVVVELWETEQPTDDSHHIIFTADATDGNHGGLLRRIASALSKRVQNGPTF